MSFIFIARCNTFYGMGSLSYMSYQFPDLIEINFSSIIPHILKFFLIQFKPMLLFC